MVLETYSNPRDSQQHLTQEEKYFTSPDKEYSQPYTTGKFTLTSLEELRNKLQTNVYRFSNQISATSEKSETLAAKSLCFRLHFLSGFRVDDISHFLIPKQIKKPDFQICH